MSLILHPASLLCFLPSEPVTVDGRWGGEEGEEGGAWEACTNKVLR